METRHEKRWDTISKRLDSDTNLVGAEIGVWHGDCSAALLHIFPRLTLHMVDRWQVYSDEEREGDSPYSKMTKMFQPSFDEAEMKTREAVKQFGERAVIIKASSREASAQFDSGTFDFVFIDGDHSYRGVKADITLWLPKVKPGGWLCGHDYGSKPGVKVAVSEMFGDNIERDLDHTWFWKVPKK